MNNDIDLATHSTFLRTKAGRGLRCLGLVLLVFFLAAGQKTWGAPISLKDYLRRIETSIMQLQSRQGPLEQGEIAALQEQFPAGLNVRGAGGAVVPVDCKGLQAWFRKVRGSKNSRGLVISRLRWLSAQIAPPAQGTPWMGAQWDRSRKILDAIYDTKEFRHLQGKNPRSWTAILDRYLKAFSEWLREHLKNLGGIQGKWADYVVYGVYGAIFLGGCLVIALILRSFGPVGWRFGHRRTPVTGPQKDPSMEWGDWEHWRDDARRQASQGAFRDAIRSLFVSALMEGHQKGWWIYEPEATNREHLARVKGPKQRQEALKRFMDLYERAWYGLGRPGEAEFQQSETYLQRIAGMA